MTSSPSDLQQQLHDSMSYFDKGFKWPAEVENHLLPKHISGQKGCQSLGLLQEVH